METLSTLLDAFRNSSLYTVYTISLHMFIRLWYFLVIGIVVGSVVSAYLPRGKLSSLARRSGFKGIVIASLLGAASPLGSYAVIPIFAALLASGLPKAPVMAFLVSSPLINPIMFFWTWTVINPSIAFARLVSAVTLGMLCGVLIDYLGKKRFILEDVLQAVSANPGTQENLEASTLPEEQASGSKFREVLTLMWGTAKYPGRYFLIAIVLAAVVETYVPTDAIIRYMGGSKTSVLIATAMSIPFYVCGGGAIPIVAQFLHMGMNKGAALAYFVVGPATRIAPMVTVLALVRKKIFLVYFIVVLVGGMGLGFLYGIL